MASRPVSAEYLTAGADYLTALRSLGLNPNFLGWGWDRSSEQWQLVLVTSIIDAGGPLKLNKLLFKAYNAKATPQEISPFIVRVFSTEIMPRDFYLLGSKQLTVKAVKPNSEPKKVENVEMTFLGLDLEMVNTYQYVPVTKPSYHERRRAWSRFRSNVERLAA